MEEDNLQRSIEQFVQSSHPSAWSYLDKTEILAGAIARLSDPIQVKQGGMPFCGPAAVAFELIRKHPARYINLCRSLYETGRFEGLKQPIVASHRLRSAAGGNLRMPPVDWMVLATLRDQTALSVPVDPRAPKLLREMSGITAPWDITSWLKNLLDYQQVKHHYTPLGGEFQVLRAAQEAIERGGIALALIDQGLLDYKVPCFSYPNHWVSILGNVDTKTKPGFDCYCWGREIAMSSAPHEVKRHLWGVSIAY
jgi:hypothetical protein